MKILIAPDKFKHSLTAMQAARAMAAGVRDALGDRVEIDLCPLADGGEGFLETLVNATNGTIHNHRVTGPLGKNVIARWATLPAPAHSTSVERDRDRENPASPQSAVFEMAEAAGLHLVPESQRDPSQTTTYGLGELMAHALRECPNIQQFIIGIGGSATNDCGIGMAAGLGLQFFDSIDRKIETPSGNHMLQVARIEGREHSLLVQQNIRVACDVTNPLFGSNGAAAVYGPQKGATREMIGQLDAGARNIARFFPAVNPNSPGMGAAGGLGFGLVAFCNASLEPGIEIVMDAVRFNERLRLADIVLTGEGRLDEQSLQGKVCGEVGRKAAAEKIPAIAIAGQIQESLSANQWEKAGLHAVSELLVGKDPQQEEEAMRNSAALLREKVFQVIGKYV